jgi:hypothetical protein
MAEIPLGNGGVTLVDDDAYEWASRWRWWRDQKNFSLASVG